MNSKALARSTAGFAVIVIALVAGLAGTIFYYRARSRVGGAQYAVSTVTVIETSLYPESATQCVFHPNVPCPGTITQTTYPVSSTNQTSTLPQGPYVLVTYHDLPATRYYSAFNTESQPGYLFLPIRMSVENHGYDSVGVAPGDFYLVVGDQEFQVSPVTFYAHGWLPTGDVLNGQVVAGYLVYEVPANYTSGWSLLWSHPNGVTVKYVHK